MLFNNRLTDTHIYANTCRSPLFEGLQEKWPFGPATQMFIPCPSRANLDLPLYLRKIGRGQFSRFSYTSINFLTEHYSSNFYRDLSRYDKADSGLRFRQFRARFKSDTFSTYFAGDIFISNVHSEIAIRFNDHLANTPLLKRTNATIVQLTNYAIDRFQILEGSKEVP